MKRFILLTLLLGTVSALCSCKKKSAEAAPPQSAESAAAATSVSPAPSPDPATATVAAPQPAPAINANAALSDVNEAIKAKDYKKAATTLIAVQQQPLTPQQAAAVHSQMVQFQGTLAGAVASGDPSAKAAADQLRAASMH